MVTTIARKEFIDTLRDGRFRTASLVVTALLLLSTAVGWKHLADVAAQHDAAMKATRAQWVGQGKKNPHSAAHYGVYAFKPKSQLAAVDSGVDPYVGVAAWLEAHKQNEFKYRPAQDRSSVQRFGELTAATTLQVLIPLVIVLLAFAAFAGEREQGTLRQVLSLGVDARQLLVGKALGVAAALAAIVVPAAALGAAAVLWGSGAVIAADPTRALLLAVAYMAYFSAFIGVSLAVSIVAPSSRVALVALIGFWMVNSLIAPRAVSDLAGAVHPTPSSFAFTAEMERELQDSTEVQTRLEARKRALFAEYRVDSVEALPVNFSGVSLQEGEEHGNDVFDRHYSRLHDRFEQQNQLVQLGGLLAPLVAMRSISMALAGTDFAQHRHFVDAAERYRRDIQRILNDDIFRNSKPGQLYVADDGLWQRVAPFQYEAPSAWWALGHQRTSLVTLMLWTVMAIGGAFVAVRRPRVD